MDLRTTGNHFDLEDVQRNGHFRQTAIKRGPSKDLQILTRSRLEWILIDVMRGSWQPQGPEVWRGKDNRGLPLSWQLRLGARQPGHSPDWWASGPELQTYRPTPTTPFPYAIPYPGRVQPVRHEPPLTALCPHNHKQWLPVTPPQTNGQALIRLIHWEGEVFYFCYCVFVRVCLYVCGWMCAGVCVCVRVCTGHLSNYSVLSLFFVKESVSVCTSQSWCVHKEHTAVRLALCQHPF